MLLNGLGVVKRRQDGVVNDRPRRHPWMDVENEFNDMLASDPLAGLNSYIVYFNHMDHTAPTRQTDRAIKVILPGLKNVG